MDEVTSLKTVLMCECGAIIHNVTIHKTPSNRETVIKHGYITPRYCPKCHKRIEAIKGPNNHENGIVFE